MMRCDELLVRLDVEGPGGLLPSDREHAFECAACARAIRAAESAERALRSAPPAPSAEFSASVMERVLATERARLRLVESRPSPWARWWRAVAEEPAALVALTLAPVALILAALWPGTVAVLVGLVRDAGASWLASAWSGAASASTVPGLLPVARLVGSALALPVVIAASFFGLQQVGEGLLASGGASVRSASRAQSESTSRRSSS